MKKLVTELDIGTLALAVSVAWLLFVQLIAVVAWETELLTRQGALLHWLVIGVLPPALALWGMPVPRR